MAGSARGRRVAAVGFLMASSAAAFALQQGGDERDTYRQLVARYRAGDVGAAQDLAAGIRARHYSPRIVWRGRGGREAAAVLNLEAASALLDEGQEDEAAALLDATRSVAVSQQRSRFAVDWLLGAGALRQAYGQQAAAFALYELALNQKPRDPQALLGRATALEASAIPDGFGSVLVADRDVWRLLGGLGDPPRELSFLLGNRRSEAPYRRQLLEYLATQYRMVLEIDRAVVEARLRLGRVLSERGHRAEAIAEIRAVAAGTDRFLATVARLCLARFETSPPAEVAAYRAVIEKDPSPGPAWLGLARALLASGNREGAEEAVSHALSPNEGRPLSAWVDYHLGRGRTFPAALDRLREGILAEAEGR
jgi:predicted negative regulator of RcsB-dependent stress response